MSKKLFRSLILLITYTVVLVLLLVNRVELTDLLRNAVKTCQPIILGFCIAFVLYRPCAFLQRNLERLFPDWLDKAARALAVLLSYALLLGAITLLFSFVIPGLESSIRTFIGSLSTYAANLQNWYDWLVSFFDLELFGDLDLSGLSAALKGVLSHVLNTLTNAVPQLVDATAKLISGIVTAFLSIVFSIYLLASGPKLVEQCRKLVVAYLPENISDKVLSVTRLTTKTFTKFITGQVTEAAILGGLCFVGMTIFRFDYAPLISVVIAVSALIPIAGAYVGAGIAFLLLVMINPMKAVWFVVFLVILQQLEGNIIYPRVVGTSIGLPGLWVLAAVTVGGGLFGFAGMILGVPCTAVIYALVKADVSRRLENKSEE